MLTVLATKEAIKATGCAAWYRDGEWRVVPPGGGEEQAYYTTDAEDAVDTAKAMTREPGQTAVFRFGSGGMAGPASARP